MLVYIIGEAVDAKLFDGLFPGWGYFVPKTGKSIAFLLAITLFVGGILLIVGDFLVRELVRWCVSIVRSGISDPWPRSLGFLTRTFS
jgi:hypothetical protein